MTYRLRSAPVLLLAAFAASALNGCRGSNPSPGFSKSLVTGFQTVFLSYRSKSEDFVVPVSGTVDIEVDMFAGDVVIDGGDDFQEAAPDVGPGSRSGAVAEVSIVSRSSHGPGRGAEGERSLDQIRVDVGVSPGSSGKTLKIRTSTAHGEPWYQATDLHIKLPQLGACRIRTSRGHVYITNNSKGVDVESTDGDVRIATLFPMTGTSTVVAEDGDIDWRVAGGSAGLYDLESVGGDVVCQIRSGTWLVNDPRNDHDSMYAVLAGGGQRVALRTVDGSIRVFVGGKPHATGPMLVDP